MSALGVIAALAAQATTPSGSAPPPAPSSAPATGPGGRASSVGSYSYVDLEGGAGYSTNPNLQFGDNTGSGFGRLSIHGVHTRVSDRTTTVISGLAQSSFYTRHYGAQQSFDLNGRHDAQVNEKLHVFADADLTYDEGGQLDTQIVSIPATPLPPGATEPPPLITPTGDFISVRGKHYNLGGHLGAQLALSTVDSLIATTGFQYTGFKSGGVKTHYTSAIASLGYDRQISTRTTIGLRGSASFTNYSGPGSTTILTPQFTIQTLISERLTLNAAIGVSFSSIDGGTSTSHTTGLSGSIGLCSRGEFDSLCARAAIDQEAATVLGPSKTISAGVDYSRRLGERDTLQFSLSASRYTTPFASALGQTVSHPTYIHGAADYSRRLSNRWFGGASVAARKNTQEGPDPKMDFSASLYIRYRLGDIR